MNLRAMDGELDRVRAANAGLGGVTPQADGPKPARATNGNGADAPHEPFRAYGAYRASGSTQEGGCQILGPEALHGLAGDVVGTIEPETEADPVAILGHLLIMFGNCVGPTPHARVGVSVHHSNLAGVFVGRSAKGRKGTAESAIKGILRGVDETWAKERVTSGLSSGEGLIWAVRDPIWRSEPTKERGRFVSTAQVVVDEGVSDKRLMVIESEFARVLAVLGREGNTLSAVIRQAWDTGELSTLTKGSPARATGALVSIIAHVTQDELLRTLDRTETANGFGNRFLWFMVQRSKLLPEGGNLTEAKLEPLRLGLSRAVEFSRTAAELRRDGAARARWAEIYEELSTETPGLAGALTARGEPQVLRLSCVYALLDRSPIVKVEHLDAALAVWRYTQQSVLSLFGGALGDSVADEIARALDASPQGLTREQIRNLFSRHESSERIGRALGLLQSAGRAVVEFQGTVGRPVERWRAVPARKARYARKGSETSREPGEDADAG